MNLDRQSTKSSYLLAPHELISVMRDDDWSDVAMIHVAKAREAIK
jgi:hypothetical protein